MKYTQQALKLAREKYDAFELLELMEVADRALEKTGSSLDADLLYASAILRNIVKEGRVRLKDIPKEVSEIVNILTFGDVLKGESLISILNSKNPYAIRIKQAEIAYDLSERIYSEEEKSILVKSLIVLS